MDASKRWVVLGLLFLVGLSAPMHFQAVAALAPFLIAEAGLTYTDVGVFTGLFMLPGIFLAAPTGPLAAKFGDRLTLAAGTALMAVSTIAFTLTDNYAAMFACRVVGGAGAVAVSVLLPKVVTDWFVGKEIATAMAIIASSVGFGIGLAMAGLPWLASLTSWQTAMHINAAIAALAIPVLFLIYREAAPKTGDRDAPSPVQSPGPPYSSPDLWRISQRETVLASLAGLGRGLFSTGYAVFMSFLPPLLIARGHTPVDAGLMTSLVAVVSLVSVPLGGYLSDRTSKHDHFIIGGSISTTLVCLLIPYAAPLALWVFLFGALRGGCTGGLMSLPSQVLRPENRSTGFAIVSAVGFVCLTAFPAIAGYLLDATGSTAAPMIFAALLWFSITPLLIAFRILQRRWIA